METKRRHSGMGDHTATVGKRRYAVPLVGYNGTVGSELVQSFRGGLPIPSLCPFQSWILAGIADLPTPVREIASSTDASADLDHRLRRVRRADHHHSSIESQSVDGCTSGPDLRTYKTDLEDPASLGG